MHSRWWLECLNYTEFAALISVGVVMVWKRQAARWPSLFAAVLLEIATDASLAILMHRPGHYRQYFFTYWISAGLQAMLRLWIIGDIVRSFPGLDYMPRKIYAFVGLVGLTMAAASASYCWHDGVKLARNLPEMIVLTDRCVTIAWATFAIAFLVAVRLLNIAWDPLQAQITTGVVSRILVGLIVGELVILKKVPITLLANGIDSLCGIAVFSLWVYSIMTYSPPPILEEGRDPSPPITALLASRFSREG